MKKIQNARLTTRVANELINSSYHKQIETIAESLEQLGSLIQRNGLSEVKPEDYSPTIFTQISEYKQYLLDSATLRTVLIDKWYPESQLLFLSKITWKKLLSRLDLEEIKEKVDLGYIGRMTGNFETRLCISIHCDFGLNEQGGEVLYLLAYVENSAICIITPKSFRIPKSTLISVLSEK